MSYHPKAGYYQHRDGGLYFLEKIGKSTIDTSEHVIYVHVYPFEKATWIRPLEEWTEERFRLIKDRDVEAIMLSNDREAMKSEITAKKMLRKS